MSEHRPFALPGARPQYGPDKVVDVLHIDLELRPDLAAKRLDGVCTTRVRAIEDGAARLVLDAVDLDVRAVTRADERARIAAGASPEEARRRARFRIFGNKPGTYGTGILQRIADGAWRDRGDLAESYLSSSGFAYGARAYGEPAPAEFRARLAAAALAVQNQDNREHD
ncbi:MAG: cobaltochelatase subunit CobN, partial [Candidatus Eremiobacteraeota bacterium]|nr:cobaltochelatase subunit CobN [Candidatus Eremiobacteraeota bacterium]